MIVDNRGEKLSTLYYSRGVYITLQLYISIFIVLLIMIYN